MTGPSFEEEKKKDGFLSARQSISYVLVLNYFLWSYMREEEPMGRTAAGGESRFVGFRGFFFPQQRMSRVLDLVSFEVDGVGCDCL